MTEVSCPCTSAAHFIYPAPKPWDLNQATQARCLGQGIYSGVRWRPLRRVVDSVNEDSVATDSRRVCPPVCHGIFQPETFVSRFKEEIVRQLCDGQIAEMRDVRRVVRKKQYFIRRETAYKLSQSSIYAWSPLSRQSLHRSYSMLK